MIRMSDSPISDKMTAARSLMAELTRAGGALRLDGEALQVSLPEAGLSPDLMARLRANKPALLDLLTYGQEQEVPLSPMQRAYWIGELGGLSLTSPALYVMQVETGPLAQGALQQAVEQVIDRHPMLRMRIDEMGQLVPADQVAIPQVGYFDGHALTGEAFSAKLDDLRAAQMQIRFGFEQANPFAVSYAIGPDGARGHLFLTLPLWRFDAASTQLLIEELLQLAQGRALAGQPASFARYASEWEALRRSSRYQQDQAYWLDRIATLPAPPVLPMANRVHEPAAGYMRHVHAPIGADDWQRLKDFASARGLTVATVSMAAYGCALSRLSGADHFTLTCLQSARDRFDDGAAQVIGNFGETLCVELDRREEPSFEAFAQRLQRQLWRDRAHMSYSGTDVAAAWRRQHGYQDGPTFPITYTLARDIAGQQAHVVNEGGRLSVPQVYLDHQIFETDHGAVLNIDYVDGVYLDGVPQELLAHYHATLQALAASEQAWDEAMPGRQGALPQKVETGHLTEECDRLEDGFLTSVASTPDATALITPERSLSYQALYDHAKSIALDLLAAGGLSGDRVVIQTRKGWQEIAAVLGTLLADMIYVPLHPTLPSLRKHAILTGCDCRLILTEQARRTEIAADTPEGVQVVGIHDEAKQGLQEQALPQLYCDTAYIIHTSGTTGTPKGVTLSHRASANTIKDLLERYQIGARDICLGLSQLSFDLSVFDIFGMLEAGGTLVLPTGEAEKDPVQWANLCHQHGVTLWNSVPALFQLVLDGGLEVERNGLRLIFLSGDWVPIKLPAKIKAACPQAKLVAMGGATEAAIWSILHEVDHMDPRWTSVPYGKAMREQAIYVLDEDKVETLPFEVGQIHIGGIGLAEGYWGDEIRTKERFFCHPTTGQRLYDTGDRGRLWPDGTVEFLGREDNQIKIQGYRIEGGDIETALVESGFAAQAAVIAVEERKGRVLHAYITAKQAETFDHDACLQAVADRLPAYMVPDRLFTLDALPLSGNGKVDRKALTRLSAEAAPQGEEDATVAFVAPSSAMEQKLAALWAEILERETLGIDDNFFDLGGSSFSGMMLMARISRALGGEAHSLALLTACPTIRQMAQRLESEHMPQSLLQDVGGTAGKRALVLLPPIGGNFACYGDLIPQLDQEFDLFALTAQGMDGGTDPFTSIEAMGQAYAALIAEQVGDDAPLLMGWSLGGLMAIEVARALQATGRRPDILAIDSRLAHLGGETRVADNREAFLGDIRLSGGDDVAMAALLNHAPDHSLEARMAHTALAVFAAHRIALHDFAPDKLDATALLIRADQEGVGETGLDQLFTAASQLPMQEDHYSIMRGAALGQIAQAAIAAFAIPDSSNLSDPARAAGLAGQSGGAGDALATGRVQLMDILTAINPNCPQDLADDAVIGAELGFSSIDQVRIIARIEDALDMDLMEDGPEIMSVGALSALLGGVA